MIFNSYRLNHYLLLILLVALPFSKAVASLAVVGLLLHSILNFRNFKVATKDILSLSPAIVFFAMLLSVSYSDNLSAAWDHLYRQNPMLIFPFILLVNRSLFASNLSLYFKCFAIAVSAASIVTLFFYVISPELALSLTSKLTLLKPYQIPATEDAFGAYSPFLDRLHFGYMIGIAFLLVLWRISTGIYHWMEWLLLLVLSTMLLILGARGAQLGCLIAVCAWLVYWSVVILRNYFTRQTTTAIIILFILSFILLLPYLTYQTVPAIQVRYNQLIWEIMTFNDGTYVNYSYTDFTSIRRILSWQNMWKIVTEQPIFGVGIGDFNAELQSTYLARNSEFPPNTHQQFLFYWGAAGLLSILAFVYSFFGLLFQSQSMKQKNNSTLVWSFWLFFLVVFLLDTPLLYQAGSMSFWIFYLLLLLLKEENRSSI